MKHFCRKLDDSYDKARVLAQVIACLAREVLRLMEGQES